VADCNARDGARVTVIGVYRYEAMGPRFEPDVPHAVRVELDDGVGPFLDPYWSKRAVRAPAEIERYLGKRVAVTGRYHKDMPRNPDDPPYASAMGGPCVEVESIEPAP
jgi:hypothetical protein